MAISVFRSNPALFRALGVPLDEVTAFTEPMNTVVGEEVIVSGGGGSFADFSPQPDNVAQDFSPASSIGRAKALRYDWYGGEMFAESPATAFLDRLLDPFARIVRAIPANLIEELKREAIENPFALVPFAAMPPVPAAMVAGAAVALPDLGVANFSSRSDATHRGLKPATPSFHRGLKPATPGLAASSPSGEGEPKAGTSEPAATSDGGLAGFRLGMKLMGEFARVTDLSAFRIRVEADLARLSDEGRLSYIKQISSGVATRFYELPSDDVPILRARLEFIHLLASEAFSARDRLPSKDAKNPLWGYSVDLWNLFNPFTHAAVAIEGKLAEKNALDPKVSEQIADVLFALASKGALYYDYADGEPKSAFALLPDVVARYRALGLDKKAAEGERLLSEVQARFGITEDPSRWALHRVKALIDENIKMIIDEPEERVRNSLLEVNNLGIGSTGSHGNYRFAAEIFRYYADALFDVVQKMMEDGKSSETHFRNKYLNARKMGIAIGTIVEANVIEGFRRIFSAPGAREKFERLQEKAPVKEFIELVEAGERDEALKRFRDYFGNDAMPISTIGSMAEAQDVLRDKGAALGKRWRIFVDTVEGNPELRAYLSKAPWFDGAYSNLKKGLALFEKAGVIKLLNTDGKIVIGEDITPEGLEAAITYAEQRQRQIQRTFAYLIQEGILPPQAAKVPVLFLKLKPGWGGGCLTSDDDPTIQMIVADTRYLRSSDDSVDDSFRETLFVAVLAHEGTHAVNASRSDIAPLEDEVLAYQAMEEVARLRGMRYSSDYIKGMRALTLLSRRPEQVISFFGTQDRAFFKRVSYLDMKVQKDGPVKILLHDRKNESNRRWVAVNVESGEITSLETSQAGTPRGREEPLRDQLLTGPGPDGGGIWGALARFQGTRSLAGRTFGVRSGVAKNSDSAGHVAGAPIQPDRHRALFRSIRAARLPAFDERWAEKKDSVIRIFDAEFGGGEDALQSVEFLSRLLGSPDELNARERLKTNDIGRTLDMAWSYMEEGEIDAVSKSASEVVQKTANAPDMAGLEMIEALFETEGRVKVPLFRETITTDKLDILAKGSSEARRDRLVLRLKFLLKKLPAARTASLRREARQILANALVRKLLSIKLPNYVAQDFSPASSIGRSKDLRYTLAEHKSPAIIVSGRSVSSAESSQIKVLVKWLRKIKPLMDKFCGHGANKRRLNKYDIEGLIPSQRKAFRNAGGNIEDYLEVVSQRPPDEQHRILEEVVKGLNRPVEAKKSLSAAAISAQPFAMVSNGGANTKWDIGELKRVIEGVHLLRRRAHQEYNEYTIEQVTVGSVTYDVVGRKTVGGVPDAHHPPATTASAGRRFRGNDSASGNAKAPRRYEGPMQDPLLINPEPYGDSPRSGPRSEPEFVGTLRGVRPAHVRDGDDEDDGDGETSVSSVKDFLGDIATLQRFSRDRSALMGGEEDAAARNILEKLGERDKKPYIEALSNAFSHRRLLYLQPVIDAITSKTGSKLIVTVKEGLITDIELEDSSNPALVAANGRLAGAMPPYLRGTDAERMIHADIEAHTKNGVPDAELKIMRKTSRTIVYAAILEEMAKVLEILGVPEDKLRATAGDILKEVYQQIRTVRNVAPDHAMMYVWRTALKFYPGTLTAEQGRAFIKGCFRIGDEAVEEIFADVPKELTDVMVSFLAPQLNRWPIVSEFKKYFGRTAKVARHGLAEHRLAAEAVRIKETAATREAFVVKMLHFMEFERASRHSNMAWIKMIAWRQALNLANLEQFSWSKLKGFFENGYDVADLDDAFSGLPHDIQPADAEILKTGIIRRVLSNADVSRNFNRAHSFIDRQVGRFAGVMEKEDEISALFPDWVKLTHERILHAMAVHFAGHMEVDFVGRLLTAAVRREAGEKELVRGFSPRAIETMKRVGIDDYFAYFYRHMRDLPMPLIEAGLDYLAGTVGGGSLNNRTEMHRRRAEIYKQILARVEERTDGEGLRNEAVNVLAKLTSGGKEIFFKKIQALMDNWLDARLALAGKTVEWITIEGWGQVEDRFGSDSVVEAQTVLMAGLPAAFRDAQIVRRIVAASVAHGDSKVKFLSRLDFYAGVLRELDARLGGNGTAELAVRAVEYAEEQTRGGEAHRGAPSRKLVERFMEQN